MSLVQTLSKFNDFVHVIISEEMRRIRIVETSGNALTMESRGRQKERERSPGNWSKYRKVRPKSKFGNIEC